MRFQVYDSCTPSAKPPDWFVLKYLLGHPDVRNYDGSWTEWGNLVRTPIEKA